ncbi:hypothetical protein [Aquipuribacter sp. SD81]|uniref:hypothetical protein n=1 Tax=Aquipuribacter sp. SD81 TaxID=3127703 RepID=UPI003018FF53
MLPHHHGDRAVRTRRLPGVAGLPVLDPRGRRLGRARGILPGATAGSPSWLVVATGALGLREALVPLPVVSLDGRAVRVPWGRDQVRHAPRPGDVSVLRPADEHALSHWYRTSASATRSDSDGRDGMAQAA